MDNKLGCPNFLESVVDLEEATRDCSLVVERVFNGEIETDLPTVAHKVDQAVAGLDQELRAVIDEKYGLLDGAEKSIIDLASKLGTTEEAVEALHQNALRALYSRPKK